MKKAATSVVAMTFLAGMAVGEVLAGKGVERNFPFNPGERLEIDTDIGHVAVHTGAASEVRVSVTSERGDLSDYLAIDFDTSDGLRIEGRKVSGGKSEGGWRSRWFGSDESPSIKFVIEAPEEMILGIKTAGGHVEIEDVVGDVEITSGGGHIEFQDIDGSLELETGGGHIQGDTVGQAVVQSGGGHIEIEEVLGDLEVRTGGGHITVGDVGGELSARSGGGHIRTGYIRADLTLRSGGGQISAKGCQGDATVETGGGDITLEGMDGFVAAETGGGDIRVELTANNTAGVELVSNGDGNIFLDVPAGGGFEVDATSGWGDVETNLEFDGQRGPGSLQGRIGGGGSRLRLHTDNGDIRIARR